MRTYAYALVALSLGTIASSPAAAQCHGPECEGQRPPMPYYFTEREGARGGFETPPPPPQRSQQQPPQQREPAPESERPSERSEVAPPPPRRPEPTVRPPHSRAASAPPRHRSVPQESGRPHHRVESLPPRYNGPRSEPPRYEGSRYDGPRHETSRGEPPRYQGPSRYETSRSEPPQMRYDGTDRWPPSPSYSRNGSIPSAPDEAQRYSYSPDGRSRITVYDSRNPGGRQQYSGPATPEYSGPPPRGAAAGPGGAGPGQVVISVEEYRALQSQARELQRLLGERNGGYRISRPGPSSYNSPDNGYPGTRYR